MKPLTVCGLMADHLNLTHVELAAILTEGRDGPISPHMAKLIRDGRMDVPAFGIQALRETNRLLDEHADTLVRQHDGAEAESLIVGLDDLADALHRRIAVRAMFRTHRPVRLVRTAPTHLRSLGFI